MSIDLGDLLARTSAYPGSILVVNDIGGRLRKVSFPDLVDRVQELRSKLIDIGLGPGHQVGIDAPNCYEWILWDLAVSAIGSMVVAIPEEVRRRTPDPIKEYGLSLLVTRGMSPSAHDQSTICLEHGEGGTTGKRISLHSQPESNPDIFSRTFSSGTSGHLKGLNISKKGSEALLECFIGGFGLSADDKYLALLPLTSYQQRLLLYSCLWSGASVQFTSIARISEVLTTAKPTFLLAPPVLYENILNKFDSQNSGESLVEALGGNIRFLITGMAPASKVVLNRFNDSGVKLIEAYGVTEVGIVAFNPLDDNRIGTVGKAPHSGEVIIDEDGAILIRREHPLSLGYFLDPNGEASTVFLENGCIHTGDLGEIDADGYITLKGRSKDVIITRGGRKLHPSELALKIVEAPGVIQASIVQTKDALEVVAVVVVKDASNANIKSAIQAHLEEINALLGPDVKIDRLVFTDTPFSLENGCLTRNLKQNRSVIYQTFSEQIESAVI